MTLSELFTRLSFWPLLLLVPLFAFGLGLLATRRRRRRAAILGPREAALTAEFSRGQRRLRRRLLTAGVLFAVVATLEPRFGSGSGDLEQRGVDLVICLDVSRSMRARDVSPDRLERARADILALAERASGNRLALVVFAGEARLLVPLTTDVAAFSELVASADPTSVARGGTDLAAALRIAKTALMGINGDHAAILLVTDGEDHEGRALAVARTLKSDGVRIHCAGYGTERGAKIPLMEGDREVFLTDEGGQEVVSALNGKSLAAVAEETSGSYLVAADRSAPLIDLYERRILKAAQEVVSARVNSKRPHRFQWPLLLALGLFLLEFSLTDRKRR